MPYVDAARDAAGSAEGAVIGTGNARQLLCRKAALQ